MSFPRTAGGLIGFVLMSVVMFVIASWVVSRVGFLQNIVSSKSAAA